MILKYKYAKHNYITMGINTFTLIIKYAITIVETDSEEYVGKHIWFYFLYALSLNSFMFFLNFCFNNCSYILLNSLLN